MKEQVVNEQVVEMFFTLGDSSAKEIMDQIIAGTGVMVPEPEIRIFASWRFKFCDVAPDVWERIQPVIYERIANLHDKGKVRFRMLDPFQQRRWSL
ncbi:MAG: hypothetical protein GXY44_02715 [Phycisphaerales bacterium]|nr:hypothetical protein [Phycisphaerales bacterium]